MLKMDRFAMARRLQDWLQLPEVQATLQAPVAHGVVQPVVAHATVHVRQPEDLETLQNPPLQSLGHLSLLQCSRSGILHDQWA
jgi:hypothetical protein